MVAGRSRPRSRRFWVLAALFGLFVVADIALFSWLIFQTLSRRELDREAVAAVHRGVADPPQGHHQLQAQVTAAGGGQVLGEVLRRVIGLALDPRKDTNYNYEIMIFGDSCVIRASPRVKGLVGFVTLGSPRLSSGSFYYSPDGADMTRAVKLIEMGFDGKGFRQ
mgnify:CR=1 FL=1